MRMLILTILFLGFTLHGRSQIPDWLWGTWTSSVEQSFGSRHEHYSMRFACQDSECKTIYRSGDCEGNWEPVKVKRYKLKFKERITVNSGICVRNVDIVIKYKRKRILYKAKDENKRFYTSKGLIYKE